VGVHRQRTRIALKHRQLVRPAGTWPTFVVRHVDQHRITDVTTRHSLAHAVAVAVAAATAIVMFLIVLGPATDSEGATPQRDGVYLAAVD
jgi:hypothetical protein